MVLGHLVALVVLVAQAALVFGLQLLPPATPQGDARIASLWEVDSSPKTIYIDSNFASKSDTDGLTLIPPTAYDFASLFQKDLSDATGIDWSLKRIDRIPKAANASGIFLGSFTSNSSSVAYENGEPTSEGYELDISSTTAFIGGTGARGMWWGTRTLLQHLLLSNGTSAPVGRVVDAPAYATRGFMLDAGRKWYDLGFLKELCSYASFFKMSEFHYHLSDNYPLNRGRNETWQDIYSHFSLLPEDDTLLGIIHGRKNETLSRAEFTDLQSHCAARGVTIIPEIEAPGHCLYLTKWKPELALPKHDLLNLSHPDAISTVKRIWAEFLPWFETKEVHVGADEYDPTLADDYIGFVNEMSTFINSTADKRTRIWGTSIDKPKKNITISKDVVIQHWQYNQSDPVLLVAEGYEIINSQDWWAYVGLKNDHMPILPAKYPQFFNESRVLNFEDEPGWQWTPADFNYFNETDKKVKEGEPLNKGAIMAAWNDNGPDASTQLEAYYAIRRGIPLVGSRSWSGSRGAELPEDSFDLSVDYFSPRAPGQNLDRVLTTPISWTRGTKDSGKSVHLGHGSKGLNYTLTLSVAGPFTLSGPDNTLTLADDGGLVFDSDGWQYPLRTVGEQDALELDPGHPGRIWINVSTSTHEPVVVSSFPTNITIATDALHGSVVWIGGQFAGRFEVFAYGGRNTQFSWSQMAFAAPLDDITGKGLRSVKLDGTFKAPSPDGPPATVPGNETVLSSAVSYMALFAVAVVTAAMVF